MNNSITLLASPDPGHIHCPTFTLSTFSLKKICRFFNLGSFRYYAKEDIKSSTAHCNYILFINTTKGKYVIKFYPLNIGSHIRVERIINRELIQNNFLTPLMHTATTGDTGIKINRRIGVCFSYIEGQPAHQKTIDSLAIKSINQAIFQLNHIAKHNHRIITCLKHQDFNKKIAPLMLDSKSLASYGRMDLIEQQLSQLIKFYAQHKKLFVKNPVHINLSLSNILFVREQVYLLDMEHVRMDYELNDLAGLVFSCLSYKIPMTNIKDIIRQYMALNKTNPDRLMIFASFVRIKLIESYLTTIKKERTVMRQLRNKPLLAHSHLLQAKKNKTRIIHLLNVFSASHTIFAAQQ